MYELDGHVHRKANDYSYNMILEHNILGTLPRIVSYLARPVGRPGHSTSAVGLVGIHLAPRVKQRNRRDRRCRQGRCASVREVRVVVAVCLNRRRRFVINVLVRHVLQRPRQAPIVCDLYEDFNTAVEEQPNIRSNLPLHYIELYMMGVVIVICVLRDHAYRKANFKGCFMILDYGSP